MCDFISAFYIYDFEEVDKMIANKINNNLIRIGNK